jgi:hypothetical protein
VNGFLDSAPRLGEPLVIGGPRPVFGSSLTQLIEGDLVEVFDDGLEPVHEVVEPAAPHNASATRSMGCLTCTPAAARW